MGQGTTARARFEIREDLPDGEIVIPLEREGLIVWAVRPGHMTPELVENVNRLLAHITGNALWAQQWDDRRSTPDLYLQPSHQRAS